MRPDTGLESVGAARDYSGVDTEMPRNEVDWTLASVVAVGAGER
jgi:hypothetical protein